MQRDKTILLVEDNAEDVFLIRRAFSAAGVTKPLIMVRDGEEAMAYLKGEGPYANREQYPLPDMMLLDLDMPKVNGFQVLTWLRSRPRWKLLPVIVLTMSIYHSDVHTAYLLGANSFLSKPVDFLDLTAAVRQMCEFWLGPCELPELSRVPESEDSIPRRSTDLPSADEAAAA